MTTPLSIGVSILILLFSGFGEVNAAQTRALHFTENDAGFLVPAGHRHHDRDYGRYDRHDRHYKKHRRHHHRKHHRKYHRKHYRKYHRRPYYREGYYPPPPRYYRPRPGFQFYWEYPYGRW